MKISIKSLRREKRVYYYRHQNGVLQRKKSSIVRATSSLMVAVFMIGGVGALSLQILDQTQKAPQPAAQRQSVAIETTKAAGEQDKLKPAEMKAKEDEQLAKKVRTKLKNIPGGQKWSVYIRDVKSDRMANVNSDNVFEAANLSNLLVTAPLEAKRPVGNWGYAAGKTTISKCVQTIISTEDVACEQAINRYAELSKSDSVFDTLGLKKTDFTDKEQKTTARDVGEYLFKLQSSQVLSDKARRIVFDGLYGQKQREGIPAGCDQKCLVANVTGESKSVRHDAAIVTVGDAQYVVVIMTSGGNWSQIADVASTVRTELQP